MTPLLLFLLGLMAAYVSSVTTAFSALMRLSLRISVERLGRGDVLGRYLDEPLRLFIPARLLLAVITVVAASLLARVTGVDAARGLPLLVVATLTFVVISEHLVPLAIVRRDPERVLTMLLPSFEVVARVFKPITSALRRIGMPRRERQPPASATEPETPIASIQPAPDHAALQEGQARELLRSLVEFRETMVREVMTPRPDIVAIDATATIGELRVLGREQQYSRFPVYNETLDNIVGFISIKDLIFSDIADQSKPITPMIRPPHFVPESKKVIELLAEFQRRRVQVALVVDEYGGTAGLVTIEDLLEEIVGEIRDEYDVEVEPVLEQTDGSFIFSGRTHIRELADRLKVEIAGEGFETVGGYLLAHVGRVPAAGETFDIDGVSVEVLEAERRRITRVRVRRVEREAEHAAEQAGVKNGYVALVGRPNAGKSTLLNRLVGEKIAIVSDKPQTTRNRITGVRNYPDGQIIFVDTPGVHRPIHRLNVRMVDTALQALRDVDVVVAVVDASEPSGGGDRFLMALLRKSTLPRVLALNKVDLLAKEALLPLIERYDRTVGFKEIVPISARTGENVERLEALLLEHLPDGERLYPDDYLTDQPERFFVAELVREQVLQHTHAELPFASAVIVDRFEEPDAKGLLRLYCTILVERESQKPIVVGRAGAMIKSIGTAARVELERFFDARVFLDLRVKVRADWREDDRMLDELGLPKPRRSRRA